MTELELRQALSRTIRQSFGDFLDLPLLSPAEPVSEDDPASSLAQYAREIRHCEACSLHIGRSQLVFGRGHWGARIAFVGDYPSTPDDKKGEPFSDEAGALLHKMILAMKVKPEEAYLTNIYKCRPPAGVQPNTEQFLVCQTHLIYQFNRVRAPVIVAMGDAPSRCLARAESPLSVLRRQIFEWQGRRVICTHHPRDIQANPQLKREVWDDLQLAMRELERLP